MLRNTRPEPVIVQRIGGRIEKAIRPVLLTRLFLRTRSVQPKEQESKLVDVVERAMIDAQQWICFAPERQSLLEDRPSSGSCAIFTSYAMVTLSWLSVKWRTGVLR